MLKETYLAKMEQIAKEKPDAVFIVVTRSSRHLLSPSWKLLNDYKEGCIDWAQYTERFRCEMDCDLCREEMKRIWDLSQTKDVFSDIQYPEPSGEGRIWDLSQTKDVFLVCYEKPGENCHRHILIELIKKDYGKNPGDTIQTPSSA